nr:hypothetical protein [Tanacetum cinerariifolium]
VYKLITEVVTAVASQVSAVSTTIPAASATIPATKLSILAAAPTVVAAYTRKRKGVTIRDPEEDFPLKSPAETPKMQNMQGSCSKRLIGIMMALTRILIGMLQWIM